MALPRKLQDYWMAQSRPMNDDPRLLWWLEARNAALLEALEAMGRPCKSCGSWHEFACDHFFACAIDAAEACRPRCLAAHAAIAGADPRPSYVEADCPNCGTTVMVEEGE